MIQPPRGTRSRNVVDDVPLGAICPFLALASDHRTALDTPDPEHRCHALEPAAPLTRAEQSALCLTDEHPSCVRFAARLASTPAPRRAATAIDGRELDFDFDFASTRLVLTPERRSWMASVGAAGRPFAAAAGAALVLVVVLVGWAVARQVISGPAATDPGIAAGGLGDLPATATPMAAVSPAAALTPSPAPTPPTATPAVTPALTPAATATPGSAATPVPVPAPVPPVTRQHVVARGDTLWAISRTYGTTVEELMALNGLEDDIINIGQVLQIP